MQFTYHARDISGQIRVGEIAAESIHAATQQLRQEGLYLLGLKEAAAAPQAAAIPFLQPRVSRNEIIYVTTQLAVMVDAGVPLASALEGLGKQVTNPTLQRILGDVQNGVQAGDDFSDALARHPKQFDRTYINLVKASEASGSLAPMLDRIATQMRTELETRQKVNAAMLYPAIMLLMCIAVSIFLLTYVFPKLTPMFKTRQLDLPLPTVLMMTLSDALVNYWYAFLIGGVSLIAAALYARRRRLGRTALDWMWLHFPVLGSVTRKVAISRSLRTLATTINAGVPMLEALELCAGVANNTFYERCWSNAGEHVAAGKQIHEALQGNDLIPPTLLQMISSGESTGKLGYVLHKVSDYFDREVENAVKSATSLLEPLMVAMMGGVIGTIALAMLLPIFKLSSHVG